MIRLLTLIFVNLLFLINTNFAARAQIINYPFYEIDNFETTDYRGNPQNWGITQGSDGRIYFANQAGVLIYDGKLWQSIFTDGDAPARSIHINENGKILVGTIADFGTISSSEDGTPKYISLKKDNSVEAIENGQIVYEIANLGDKIIIRTKKGLYELDNNELSKLPNPENLEFEVLHIFDDHIYIYCKNKGIFKFINNKFEILPGTEVLNKTSDTVYFIDKKNDGEFILFTRKSGIFQLKQNLLSKINIDNQSLDKATIYRAIKLKNENIALATYDGIFILNKDLKVDYHFDTTNGLLDNNVRSLFEDRDGNLWAGLNNGISKIKLSSYTRSYPQDISNINSLIRDVVIFNNEMFIATEIGIKKLQTNHDKLRDTFTEVSPNNLQTQVWDLLTVDNILFVGSNIGFGQIDNETYKNIIDPKLTGSVYKIEESVSSKDVIIIGASNGLFLFNLIDKSILKINDLENGKVSDFVEEENGNFWVRIIGKGVYKINFVPSIYQPTIRKYTHADGLPDNVYRDLNLHLINNKIIVGTKYGTFIYSDTNDGFIKFNDIIELSDHHIKDSGLINGNTWVSLEKKNQFGREVNFYEINKNFGVKNIPLGDLKNQFNFKFVFFNDFALISNSSGVTIVNSKSQAEIPYGQTIITQAKINNKNIYNSATLKIFNGGDATLPSKLSHDQNKLNFLITATDYSNEKKILFRYKLVGIDDFSNWTNNNYVTYTNLSPGFYKLIIESKNYFEQQLKPFEYEFTITPPWWETNIFYISEVCFFILLFLIIIYTKKSSKGSKIATSLIFLVILIIFEIINTKLDPLVDAVSGGVPVFALASKIVLALLLEPLVGFSTTMIDKLTGEVKKAA